MASREKWYNRRARIAEEHLKSIPYEKLGPAGKVLVDNPRDRSAKNSRERLKELKVEVRNVIQFRSPHYFVVFRILASRRSTIVSTNPSDWPN